MTLKKQFRFTVRVFTFKILEDGHLEIIYLTDRVETFSCWPGMLEAWIARFVFSLLKAIDI